MGARAKLTKTDGTGRAMWRKDGEKAGSQVTMLENLDYEMDPFLQQIFISTRLCVPAFALGAGDMAVNTHTVSPQEVWAVTYPCEVQCQHFHLLFPKSSAKSTMLAKCSGDELAGGDGRI